MIKNIKRKKRTEERTKKVWKLIQEWAYYDAIAQYKPLGGINGKITCLEYIESLVERTKREHRIRKIVLGKENLHELANDFGVIKNKPEERRKKKRSNKDVEE